MRHVVILGLLFLAGPVLGQESRQVVLEKDKPAIPVVQEPAVKPMWMSAARELRHLVAQPTDALRAGIDPGTPLRDALDTIARLISKGPHAVPIHIDYALFKDTYNEETAMVDQRKVGLPALPKGQSVVLDASLRQLLKQAGATYLIQGNRIVIVPDTLRFDDELWADALRVSLQADKLPLNDALEQLSDASGISIVVDPAVGEKATAPLNAALVNVPVTTAVRVLANMADLKPVVMDKVLYVTTKDRAKELIEGGEAEQLPMLARIMGPA
jgi:hypothetical protein